MPTLHVLFLPFVFCCCCCCCCSCCLDGIGRCTTRSRKAFLSLCPECDDVDVGKGRDLEKKKKNKEMRKHKRSPETQKKKKKGGWGKRRRSCRAPGRHDRLDYAPCMLRGMYLSTRDTHKSALYGERGTWVMDTWIPLLLCVTLHAQKNEKHDVAGLAHGPMVFTLQLFSFYFFCYLHALAASTKLKRNKGDE